MQATVSSNAPKAYQAPLPSPGARPRVPDKPSQTVDSRPALGLRDVPPTQQSNVPPASVITTGAYVAPGLLHLMLLCASSTAQDHHITVAEEQKPTPAQQAAYSLLSSDPHRTASAEVLSKVLNNIVNHPTEAKYR